MSSFNFETKTGDEKKSNERDFIKKVIPPYRDQPLGDDIESNEKWMNERISDNRGLKNVINMETMKLILKKAGTVAFAILFIGLLVKAACYSLEKEDKIEQQRIEEFKAKRGLNNNR